MKEEELWVHIEKRTNIHKRQRKGRKRNQAEVNGLYKERYERRTTVKEKIWKTELLGGELVEIKILCGMRSVIIRNARQE